MSSTVEGMKTLTAVDRCDGCGAQARVHVELPAGGELLFCAHHFSKDGNDIALRGIGAKINDQRDVLVT